MQAIQVIAVVPTQKAYTEAVSLAYPHLFTWMQHSCVFAKVDAMSQLGMTFA